MFTSVQNYKRMFLLFIRNEFNLEGSGWGLPDEIKIQRTSKDINSLDWDAWKTDTDNNWLSVNELVDSALSDNKIDKKELTDIQNKYKEEKEKIGAKTWEKVNQFMHDMYIEMLEDWINVSNEQELSDLLSRFNDLWIIIPNDVQETWKGRFKPSWFNRIVKNFTWEGNIRWVFKDGKFEAKIDRSVINNDYVDSGEIKKKWYTEGFLDEAILDKMSTDEDEQKLVESWSSEEEQVATVNTVESQVATVDTAKPQVVTVDTAKPQVAIVDTAEPQVATVDTTEPQVATVDTAGSQIATVDTTEPQVVVEDIEESQIASEKVNNELKLVNGYLNPDELNKFVQNMDMQSAYDYFNMKQEAEKKEIQRLLWTKDDWIIWPKTLTEIVRFQALNNLEQDWKVGPLTLAKLVETAKTSVPKIKESGTTETISEDYTQVKEWIKELFKDEKDIDSFTWINGEKVIVEFDDEKDKFSLDTSFFDSMADFDLSLAPTYITSKEDAKIYVNEKMEDIKKEYDNKVMKNAIDAVKGKEDSLHTISTFAVDWEVLKVQLAWRVDFEGEYEGTFVTVNTPWGDGISDSQVSTEIKWEVTRNSIEEAAKKVEEKYKRVYDALQS